MLLQVKASAQRVAGELQRELSIEEAAVASSHPASPRVRIVSSRWRLAKLGTDSDCSLRRPRRDESPCCGTFETKVAGWRSLTGH